MKKRDAQLAAIIVFASVLAIFAMSGGNTQAGEIRQIQDAMRSLRRVNNLQFTYYVTLSDKEESNTLRTELWVNQLTGSWVEEDYTIDSDGTRPVLKRYCDGKSVYNYIDWNGDWSKITNMTKEQLPWLEQLMTIDYGSEDIVKLECETDGEYVTISYTFTPEYLATQTEKMRTLLENEYANYVFETDSGINLPLEQCKQMRIENPKLNYRIDKNGVLAGGSYSLEIIWPEILENEQGEKALGEEQKTHSMIAVEIKGYNQDSILDKIEQLESEIQ